MKYVGTIIPLLFSASIFCTGPFDQTVQKELPKFVHRIKKSAELHLDDCESNGAYQIYSWLDTQFTTQGFQVMELSLQEGVDLAQLTLDNSEFKKDLDIFTKKAEELAQFYQTILFKTFHRLNREEIKNRGIMNVAEPAKRKPNESDEDFRNRAPKEETQQFFERNKDLEVNETNKKEIMAALTAGMMCRQIGRRKIQDALAIMKEWYEEEEEEKPTVQTSTKD